MDTEIRPLHMLSTRDPPQNRGHIQTESEGLEINIQIISTQRIGQDHKKDCELEKTNGNSELHGLCS